MVQETYPPKFKPKGKQASCACAACVPVVYELGARPNFVREREPKPAKREARKPFVDSLAALSWRVLA